MKRDVCYNINRELINRKSNKNNVCINTSVEATTLRERWEGKMYDQDKFIRDNITKDDILVVSVGGP
eukprot:UN01460